MVQADALAACPSCTPPTPDDAEETMGDILLGDIAPEDRLCPSHCAELAADSGERTTGVRDPDEYRRRLAVVQHYFATSGRA